MKSYCLTMIGISIILFTLFFVLLIIGIQGSRSPEDFIQNESYRSYISFNTYRDRQLQFYSDIKIGPKTEEQLKNDWKEFKETVIKVQLHDSYQAIFNNLLRCICFLLVFLIHFYILRKGKNL